MAEGGWWWGGGGGAQMHNLSKSRPSSYLFTDLFNKRAREREREREKRICKQMNLPVVVTVY